MGDALRFTVAAKVGDGGMCEVFRAVEDGTGRALAVKVLRPELASDPRERERFFREARVCASLEHRNVLGLLCTVEHDGRPALVMPFVPGATLRGLLDRGLKLGEGLALMVQVADALAHAHGRKVLHRDLKPENILVADGGRVLVADWGLAHGAEDRERLTRTGLVLGTPTYMAPEQITAGALEPPVDLYALGVILFELVAGRPPFPGPSPNAIMQGHLTQPPPSLGKLAPEAPPPVLRLIDALLAKKPADRPDSAATVARELRRLARTRPEAAAPREVTATLSRVAPRPGRPRATAALALAAAVALGGAWLARRSGPAAPPALPFALRDVRVVRPAEIELRFTGLPSGRCRLTLTPDDPQRSAPGAALTTEVDLGLGLPCEGGGFRLPVRLPRPVLRRSSLEASLLDPRQPTAEAPPLAVDPAPYLEGLLGRLDGLRADDATASPSFRASLRELDKVRLLWLRQERGEPGGLPLAQARSRQRKTLADLLDLSEEAFDRFAATVAELAAPGLVATSDLARRLQPLRYVEAIFASTPDLGSPFAGLSALTGVDLHPAAGPLGLPPGWHQLAVDDRSQGGPRDPTSPLQEYKPGAIWIVQPGGGLKNAITSVLRSQWVGADDDAQPAGDLRPAQFGSAVERALLRLAVRRPPGASGPPAEVALDLVVANFFRGCEVLLQLPGEQPVVLVHTSTHRRLFMARDALPPVVVEVRLAPRLALQDQFEGAVVWRALDFDEPLLPIGLIRARLRARWEPR